MASIIPCVAFTALRVVAALEVSYNESGDGDGAEVMPARVSAPGFDSVLEEL